MAMNWSPGEKEKKAVSIFSLTNPWAENLVKKKEVHTLFIERGTQLRRWHKLIYCDSTRARVQTERQKVSPRAETTHGCWRYLVGWFATEPISGYKNVLGS